MAEPIRTLADALLEEITRVRDQVMPAYLEIGQAGGLALLLMRADLDHAAQALAEQDAVSCLRLYEALKGYHT